ncbi:MAG TPA: NAD-dependent epimerase/dehydratase family protein [Thermomicrobiales bacterium]|jgi:uncharacterized protein YbjT (DUF2867 family)
MNVLVTGATGFTGSRVVPLLIERGYGVRCFVRPSGDRERIRVAPGAVEWAAGDLADPASLRRALTGVDALVNIASLGFGHAPGIVEAARAAGVRRAIFVGTTAIFTNLNAPSKAVRTAAEETIRESGLDWTLVRPTMIYGGPDDRNIARLIRYLRRAPVIPIFGDGRSLQQPVYVGDVARALVEALAAPVAIGQAYNVSGAAPLTYNEVIATVCAMLSRRVGVIHLPAGAIIRALGVAERLPIPLPIKAEQVLRLNEDKAFDHAPAARDMGYQPRTFREGIALQLAEMGLVR